MSAKQRIAGAAVGNIIATAMSSHIKNTVSKFRKTQPPEVAGVRLRPK
jgi:hypothetical protein